jgi:hypothetical protein
MDRAGRGPVPRTIRLDTSFSLGCTAVNGHLSVDARRVITA